MPNAEASPPSVVSDSAPEDRQAIYLLTEFLPYLLAHGANAESSISAATSPLFQVTDTWKFTPSTNIAGGRGMGTGTWIRHLNGSNTTTEELGYQASMSPDGTSVTLKRVMEGIGAELQRYAKGHTISLGTPQECRQRALRMLRALPFWVEGPIAQRVTHDIGPYDVSQELPFEINRGGQGGGQWKSKLLFSASWRRGETDSSPQATIQLQLQHVVNFQGSVPLYRPFFTMNASDKGVRVDLSFPGKARPPPETEESILYFITLFCSHKEFRA